MTSATATLRRLNDYYYLTKPGIIRGNILSAAAGFLLAAGTTPDLGLLAVSLAGLALVIASACVTNNYLDRTIDTAMERTKQRAIAAGRVSGRSALLYASGLGIVGGSLLAVYTNYLCLIVAIAGWLAYVVLYGIGKRRTVYGTLIGTISGALPPVVGYTAVTGRLDAAALCLFVILIAWQLPHFYAIALYRLNDYKAAKLPVWPAVKGIASTKRHITWSIIGFMLAAASLSALGYTGQTYLVLTLLLAVSWLWQATRRATDNQQWAKRVFLHSLFVLSLWCILTAGSAWLP